MMVFTFSLRIFFWKAPPFCLFVCLFKKCDFSSLSLWDQEAWGVLCSWPRTRRSELVLTDHKPQAWIYRSASVQRQRRPRAAKPEPCRRPLINLPVHCLPFASCPAHFNKISVQLLATCEPLQIILYTIMNVPNLKQPYSLSKLILGLFSSLVSLKRQWFSQCLMPWYFFSFSFSHPIFGFSWCFLFCFFLSFF